MIKNWIIYILSFALVISLAAHIWPEFKLWYLGLQSEAQDVVRIILPLEMLLSALGGFLLAVGFKALPSVGTAIGLIVITSLFIGGLGTIGRGADMGLILIPVMVVSACSAFFAGYLVRMNRPSFCMGLDFGPKA